MKKLFVFLGIGLLLVGCATTSVTITDGTKYRTIKLDNDIKIENDSIFFRSKAGTPYYLPLDRYDYTIAKRK